MEEEYIKQEKRDYTKKSQGGNLGDCRKGKGGGWKYGGKGDGVGGGFR